MAKPKPNREEIFCKVCGKSAAEDKHFFNIKCIANILLISFVYTSVFIALYLFYEDKYIIILLSISNSLLSSAILSIFNIMSSKFMNPWSRFIFVNANYIISFILSLIISSIVIAIFFTFTIKIFVFTSIIILLSFIISLLLTHYIKAYSYLYSSFIEILFTLALTSKAL